MPPFYFNITAKYIPITTGVWSMELWFSCAGNSSPTSCLIFEQFTAEGLLPTSLEKNVLKVCVDLTTEHCSSCRFHLICFL